MGGVSKYHREGIRYTIARGFDIPWMEGSKYHRKGVRYTMGRWIDIPWIYHVGHYDPTIA